MGWLVCWLVYVKSTMIIYNVGMFFSLQFIIFSLIFKIINCSPMSYCIPISHNVHPSLQLWFKERVSSKIDFYLKLITDILKMLTDIDEIVYWYWRNRIQFTYRWFCQYWYMTTSIRVKDFVNIGEGTFSKIWAGSRCKSKIPKTWKGLRNMP